MATEPTRIRTIAITGQGGVGKTSVADALVFAAGGNNRLGRVDDETSLFDIEPEEQRRRCSISSGLYSLSWQKNKVTIIDTPGHGNFVIEASFALRAVAGMVLVLDPTAPLRAETLKVWSWAGAEGVPCLAFVNRLDRPEIDLDGLLEAVGEQLGVKPALVQIPVGAGESLTGVADVLRGKAYLLEGTKGSCATADVPDALQERVAELRASLMEDAAEADDGLLERYLEAGVLDEGEFEQGLRAAVSSRSLLPVLCGSATANIGFPQLLDSAVRLLPAPCERPPERAVDGESKTVEVAPDPQAPFAGLVFKTIIDPHAGQLSVLRVFSGAVTGDCQVLNTRTGARERIGHVLCIEGRKTRQVEQATVGELVAVAKLKDTHTGDTLSDPARPVSIRSFAEFHPVISFAVEAKKRGEEDKAVQGLQRLAAEDPALRVDRDEGSGDILLSGAGQLHVEVSCERLQRKYGVEVVLKAPKVPYRETIRKKVKAHGRLKKQTGGHGQFADCWVEMEPLARGQGFEFVNKVVGGAIPRGFIPAVEKGVIEAMKGGSVAGYPVVDVRVTLYDGQYHEVDSSEMAFKVAGSLAFKGGLAEARPCVLEPYVSLEVAVPDDCMGDVMGDLNARRAKVEGMEQAGQNQVIRAKAPMAEVLRYAPDLTSMTSGRGSFEISFSHYEQMPEHLVAKVVEELRARKDEGLL